MKIIGVIVSLLVISSASLTCSNPLENGLENVNDNHIPTIFGGFINQLLENVIAFLQRILTQLNQRNLENDMSGNLSSSDDNLNGANQMINELKKSQMTAQLSESSKPIAANGISNESNESKLSDEEFPVKPKFEIKKNKSAIINSGNVDCSGKFDSLKPKKITNVAIGGSRFSIGDEKKSVNMGKIDSNGNNTGFKNVSNIENQNTKNKKDDIENNINVNCNTKTVDYNGKTYVDSEYEIVRGGNKSIRTTISGLVLKRLAKARKLSNDEKAWVKEKLKSCYEKSDEFEEYN